MILLASGSASRRAMLDAAGVAFEIDRPDVDEDAAKLPLRAAGADAVRIATELAVIKALDVSHRRPGRIVVGSDSMLELADGTTLDKPESRETARAQLLRMRGGRHRLVSAVAVARDGVPAWRMADAAILDVRAFSDTFLDAYLDAEWPAIVSCVGCFRIEGPGVQLFERIEGSQFTVLGMPLLPLLAWLRGAGALTV